MDLQPTLFNRRSEKQNFIYRHSPAQRFSFTILRLDAASDRYREVGTYSVLDRNEDPDVTEMRVTNIVLFLNNRDEDVQNIGNLTRTRTLYNIVEGTSEEEADIKVVFRTHDGRGTSRENAMMVIEKGAIDDRIISRRNTEQ